MSMYKGYSGLETRRKRRSGKKVSWLGVRFLQSFYLPLGLVLRVIEEEDALWQKKSRKKKENTITENPDRDVMPGSSDTVYTSGLGGDALPKNTGQRLRRSTDPSHGFY